MDKIYLGDFLEKWNRFVEKKISEAEAIDMIKERMDSFDWQDGARIMHQIYLPKEQMIPALQFIKDVRFSFWFGLRDGKKTVEYTWCNH